MNMKKEVQGFIGTLPFDHASNRVYKWFRDFLASRTLDDNYREKEENAAFFRSVFAVCSKPPK